MVAQRWLVSCPAALTMVWLSGVCVGATGAEQPQARAATADSSQRALLDEYCVRCHNTRRLVGGLALDTVDPDDVGPDAEVWERALRKLQARAMPPAGSPRPEEAAYVGLVSHLETALDRAAALDPNPTRGWCSSDCSARAAARTPRSGSRGGGCVAASSTRFARRSSVCPGVSEGRTGPRSTRIWSRFATSSAASSEPRSRARVSCRRSCSPPGFRTPSSNT